MPDRTIPKKIARSIDGGVSSLFQTCVGVNTDSWTNYAKERLHLPIHFKGWGLREDADRRHGKYVGVILQSTVPLLDRTDSNNCMIEGRLNIPASASKHLFGVGSFGHPFTVPWGTILSSSSTSSNLASELRHTWSHSTTKFQEVITH